MELVVVFILPLDQANREPVVVFILVQGAVELAAAVNLLLEPVIRAGHLAVSTSEQDIPKAILALFHLLLVQAKMAKGVLFM